MMTDQKPRRWPVLALIRLTFRSAKDDPGQLFLALLPTIILLFLSILGTLTFLYAPGFFLSPLSALGGFGYLVVAFGLPLIWMIIRGLALAWGLVTWHRRIVLGETGMRGIAWRDVEYALAVIAMALPGIAISLLAFWLLLPAILQAEPGAPNMTFLVAYSVSVQFIVYLVSLVVYTKWGLALPYISVRESGQVRNWSAPGAISVQFWPVFWALAAFTLLQFIVAIGVSMLLPSFLFTSLIVETIFTLIIFIGAGVLSHAYLLLTPSNDTL